MGGQPLCKQSCAWDRGLCRQVGTGVCCCWATHAAHACICRSASCHKQSWMQGWGTSAASPPKPAAASRMSCSRGKQCHPATALNGKCVNSLLYLLYACPLLVMPSPHQNNGVTGCSVTMHCALFRHMMSTRETAASARRGPAVWRCKCICHRAGRQAGTPCAPQKLHAARMRRCSLPRLQTSMCPCTASPPFVSQTCCNMQRKAMNQVDRWGPNVRDLQSTAIARSDISLCASWPQLEDIRECRALHPHVCIVIGRILIQTLLKKAVWPGRV